MLCGNTINVSQSQLLFSGTSSRIYRTNTTLVEWCYIYLVQW